MIGGIFVARQCRSGPHTRGVATSWAPVDLASVALWRRLRCTRITATVAQKTATATTPPTTPMATKWAGTDEPSSSSTTVSADDKKKTKFITSAGAHSV